MNYSDPELRDRLAAEYALGTLRGAARRRFERLMAADPALRDLATAWEMRLNGMAERAPAVAPPARVWQAIERALGFGAERRSRLAALFGGARVRLPSLAESGLWNFVGFWRPAGILAAAAAIILAVYVGTAPTPTAPTHVAVLNDQSTQQPAMLASFNAPDGRLALRSLKPQPLEADRDFELWLVPPDSSAPRSLGVLAAEETVLRMSASDAADLAGGALAVSLEPKGGSPTGTATGPILFVGAMLPADL